MEPTPPAELKPSTVSPRTESLGADATEEETLLANSVAAICKLPEDASDVTTLEQARSSLQNARRTLRLLQTAVERMQTGHLSHLLATSSLSTQAEQPPAASAQVENICSTRVIAGIERATRSMYVGVDGSDNCSVALNVALSLRKGDDQIHLCHVNAGTSNWESMRSEYEAKMLSIMLPSKYSIELLPMKNSIRETIVTKVNSSELSSMFVCGFIRAGLETGNNEEAETIGTSEDLSMRDMHVPSLIVKRPIANNESRYFVCLTNGSESCWRGYLLATRLMKPRDEIIVAHFYKPGAREQAELDENLKIDNVKARYEGDIKDRGLHGRFEGIQRVDAPDNAFKVALGQISEFLKDNSPDFLVICPRPNLADDVDHYKKSLTEAIIKSVNCNMLICKS